MTDLICRKSMVRCQTPGMCSPHGGCGPSVQVDADVRYSAKIESRAQFEAVFREQFPLIFAAAKSGEPKAHGDLSVAWWSWEASRKALLVEFPPAPAIPDEPEGAIDDSHMDAYHSAMRMRSACVSAIEAKGLTVVVRK